MSNQSVAERVAVHDVLRVAGFEAPNARGFMRCPIHAERSASFHVVGKGRGFRCFGCGARGGILDLVVALGIARDRAGAARWLEAVIP